VVASAAGCIPKIRRSAEDGRRAPRQAERDMRRENMLLGIVNPAARVAIGVVVLVIGVVVHKVIFDVAGAAVAVIGCGQWLYRARRGEPRR
jgi:hypothetical protein